MLPVDLSISDIVSGYYYILAAEKNIRNRWSKSLLTAYAQQRKFFAEELSEFEKQRLIFARRLRLGIWLASALLILGMLVLPGLLLIVELGDIRGAFVCFAPILILGGLTGWGTIFFLWISQRNQAKPIPPSNPLRSGVLYPLLPIWKEGLHGNLPSKKTHPGEQGVLHFIARLMSLRENFYILYGLNLIEGEIIDVLLIGSKGIWVFEIEHLEGLIRWQDGIWTQESPRGFATSRSSSQASTLDQAPDKDWQQAANSVSQTIKRHVQDLTLRSPNLTRVQGGIVFTHPKGRYAIPPGCPFNWGVVPFWLEKLRSVPNTNGKEEAVIMELLEAILNQHRKFAVNTKVRSMLSYAHQIELIAEDYLREWIERNSQLS